MAPSPAVRKNLLAWQWSLYPDGHQSRRNLLIHLFTTPLFMAGCLMLLLSPLNWRLALAGVIALFVPLALQGAGHKGEVGRPVPFAGPLDVVSRFLVEQWVSFPRYILSGRFGEAWRRAGSAEASPPRVG